MIKICRLYGLAGLVLTRGRPGAPRAPLGSARVDTRERVSALMTFPSPLPAWCSWTSTFASRPSRRPGSISPGSGTPVSACRRRRSHLVPKPSVAMDRQPGADDVLPRGRSLFPRGIEPNHHRGSAPGCHLQRLAGVALPGPTLDLGRGLDRDQLPCSLAPRRPQPSDHVHPLRVTCRPGDRGRCRPAPDGTRHCPGRTRRIRCGSWDCVHRPLSLRAVGV